jgi:hypothetical protein
MSREDFIQAHIAVCSRSGAKKWLKSGKHYGTGRWRRSSEASRKRACARGLWLRCEKLGIAPVLHHADLPKESNAPKGH